MFVRRLCRAGQDHAHDTDHQAPHRGDQAQHDRQEGRGTRARKTAATNASRAKTNVKRRVSQPQTNARGIRAQVEFVGAVAGNVVQTGLTAGTKVAAGAAKRVADIF